METSWEDELRQCQDKTFELLQRIQRETGCGFKHVRTLVIDPTTAAPTWHDGQVRISPTHDARAIAHEIGHGMHEKLREAGWEDQYGEDFAEAIRWFVEQSMGPSQWCDRLTRLPGASAILRACNQDFDQFVLALRDGHLFSGLGWRRRQGY